MNGHGNSADSSHARGPDRRRGVFIAIEGRDGTGKTVQVPRVADRLRGMLSVDVRETREPGATRLGTTLREMLLEERKHGAAGRSGATDDDGSDAETDAEIGAETGAAAGSELSERARLLLFAADNAQHAAEIVRPALNAGRWVLSDRSLGSALAYQGFGFGFGAPTVRRIYEWAIEGTVPDLTVMLDCDDTVTAQRLALAGPLDSIERLGGDFHSRVRDGYRHLAAADRTWVTVDATPPIPEVTDAIVEAVLAWHRGRHAPKAVPRS